jgi:hypothetical protein
VQRKVNKLTIVPGPSAHCTHSRSPLSLACSSGGSTSTRAQSCLRWYLAGDDRLTSRFQKKYFCNLADGASREFVSLWVIITESRLPTRLPASYPRAPGSPKPDHYQVLTCQLPVPIGENGKPYLDFLPAYVVMERMPISVWPFPGDTCGRKNGPERDM